MSTLRVSRQLHPLALLSLHLVLLLLPLTTYSDMRLKLLQLISAEMQLGQGILMA